MTHAENVKFVAQQTGAPQVAGKRAKLPVNGSSGILFMSQSAFLYQAMSTMSKYDMEMMQQWLTQQKNNAEAYAGFSSSKDGGMTLNGHGLVDAFIQESNASAEASGQSIREDAWSNYVQAGVGAAGFAAQGVAIAKTGTGDLDAQKADAIKLRENLKGPQEADIKQAGASSPPAPSDEVTTRMNQWADGGPSSIAHYEKDAKGNNLDEKQADLNRKTAVHARSQPEEKLNAIKKNNDALVENIDREINTAKVTRQNAFMQIQLVQGLGNNVAQAAFQMKKASDTVDAAKAKAQADVLQQLQSQIVGTISNAAQQAAAFQQAADAAAAGYGQITQTRA